MKHYPKHSKLKSLVLIASMLTSISSLSATTFNITGNTNDTNILSASGTSTWVGQPTLSFGYNTTHTYMSVFHMFELPAIPEGEVITDATLTFELLTVQSFGADLANGDLFALDYRSTPSVTPADHYEGAYGDSSDTGIQDDIVTRLSSTGTISTDATGSSNITNYINTQITNGASAGDFLIFRYNIDDSITMSSTRYYTIAMADNSTSSFRPVLTLTTGAAAVPEASTYALLTGLAGLAFIAIRRKRA